MKRALLVSLLCFSFLFRLSPTRPESGSKSMFPISVEKAEAGVALAIPALYIMAAGVGLALIAGAITQQKHDELVSAINAAIDDVMELPTDIYNEITVLMAAISNNYVTEAAKTQIRYRGPSDHDRLCRLLEEWLDAKKYDQADIVQAQKYMQCRNSKKQRRSLKDDE